MFERFTEPARRAIFFARFEASVFGSPYIESEHLLLGLLRDDPVIRTNLPVEAIRKQVERLIRRKKALVDFGGSSLK
jgi:ATP-dependent Clp protease ATP-binding subunit ClpC